MKRRIFLKSTSTGIALSLLPGLTSFADPLLAKPEIVKIINDSPAILTRTAVEKLGGMQRFITNGDRVVVKPNIGWDRSPAQAANTNPEVVAEVIKMCLEAEAKDVQVFDNTCNTAKRCYHNSGIAQAAKDAGAKVSFIIDKFFTKVTITDGKLLKSWEFYRPALDADKYINVPVLKHHGLSSITVGFKNIMGVIGGNRGSIHRDFDIKIVDLNTVIKPALTIVDATKVLKRNGPTGGSLGDVEEKRLVIAGLDPVAVDTAAADVFGVNPMQLGMLHEAQARGLGSMAAANSIATFDLNN